MLPTSRHRVLSYHLINFQLPSAFFFFNVTWSRVNVQGADIWFTKFRERNRLAFWTSVLGRVPGLLQSLMQWQNSLDLGRGFICWAAKNNNKTLPRSIVIQWKDKGFGASYLNVLKLSFLISNIGMKITTRLFMKDRIQVLGTFDA